ncbi:MAG TPA: EAL domain-containing protein, partial [Bryobacteraceae bacterium]|nr:EAL domain-containing protein [Bryobacteraceae bacterium]
MAPVPLSLVLGLLLAAWLCTDLVYYFWPHPLRFWQVHCRFAIEAAGVTAVMYVGGWGPALMIGYIYLAADNMRSIGARALLPSMFWAAVCTLIAQTAIAAGWAPTIIPLPLAHGLALFGLLGSCLGIYLVGSAFGQSERSQAALRRVAYDDPVTGLPNRPFFVECLTSAIADARAAQNRLAVLLFGLDDFKLVNDSLGLSVGDGLLRAVGALLQRHLQADDLLAHFGSDEFIVLIRDVAGPKVASERAERLLNLLRQPFVMDGGPRFLSASVGVALGGAGDGEITADGLLQAADAALHQAKLAGGSRVTVFAPDMTASARARLDIETDLRQAVRHDQLRVYYQPYVDLQTGRILGLEALLRWEHPQHGLMLPDQFIHIAEQTGSIVSLGRWVLREACRQARLLEAYSPDRASLTVSVNLSVKELLQPDLAQNVSEIIREAGIDAERINLEITESAVMQDAEFGIATLQALRGAGVRLAIDDFGTGYS